MKKYGLCFSGGGGKGAYEIGVWKALKYLGKVFDITAVSGTSVGALNGVLFAAGDYEHAEELWKRVSTKDVFSPSVNGLFLSDEPRSKGISSRDGLLEMLHHEIDYDKVKFSSVKVYVNTSVVEESLVFPEKPEEVKPNLYRYIDSMHGKYYCLNSLEKEQMIQILLAATAFPAVYPSVHIDGEKMADGGLTDNVPIKPLINEAGCSNLIVVMCGKDNEYDIYTASRAEEIIEIRPSREIGNFLDGTLDFQTENINFRIQLGFYDTLRVFDIQERKQMGLPYTEEERRQSEKRDYENIMTALNAGKAVERMQDSRRQYDNMLKKYSEKYGIDL